MLLASDDDGATWFKHREVAQHDIAAGDGRLITPRISLLNDGRVVVIVDQDDFTHFHEEQPPGILAWWSEDGGRHLERNPRDPASWDSSPTG